MTDANGNTIQTTDGSHFTDTLGMTALTVSGGPPNPLVFQYAGPAGDVSVYVDYSAYTVQTNFGCSGIGELPATPVYLVSRISLPDGTSYTFQYETTPGNPADGWHDHLRL